MSLSPNASIGDRPYIHPPVSPLTKGGLKGGSADPRVCPWLSLSTPDIINRGLSGTREGRQCPRPPSNQTECLFYYLLNFGSRASLNPSPNRLNPNTTVNIASPGKTHTQGWVVRYLCPSVTIVPQLGIGG